MPRRAPNSAAMRRRGRGQDVPVVRTKSRWLVAALIAVPVLGAVVWALVPEGPEHLRARAEAAQNAADWPKALALWRAVNAGPRARGRTYLAEARACLALNRAAQAEQALHRATEAAPEAPEPWRLLLQLYRVEERGWEARRLGEQAIAAVLPSGRREVLRDATLALLADVPDAQARAALDRWTTADPADLDARVARLRRATAHPLAGDPDRASRIAELTTVLERTPANNNARELLVESLADAGAPDRGRQVLDGWPASARDARYDRLLGRWQLEYEHDPDSAARSFSRALEDFPYDWRTHYRLARAWRALGRDDDARREAQIVGRLRELLDPDTLGPRLRRDIDRLDESASCRDLADLSAHAGLLRFAEAWRQEAETRARPTGASASDAHDAVAPWLNAPPLR